MAVHRGLLLGANMWLLFSFLVLEGGAVVLQWRERLFVQHAWSAARLLRYSSLLSGQGA